MDAQVECSTRLIADNPGIVSRRDQIDITGSGLNLGAIVHPETHPSRDEITEVPFGAQLACTGVLLVL
jgi:hypothetical protein